MSTFPRWLVEQPLVSRPHQNQRRCTGRSGSGKTTLLLMLGTLLCPTSDTITVHTRPGGTVDVAAAPDRDLPVSRSHVRLSPKLSQTCPHVPDWLLEEDCQRRTPAGIMEVFTSRSQSKK